MREDCREFLGRHDFQSRIRAIGGLLVRPPSAEMRHMTEAVALHVLVGNFDDEFRT